MLNEGKNDAELGAMVSERLREKGLETLTSRYRPPYAEIQLRSAIEEAMHELGIAVDDSTQDTPRRFAKMFVQELCAGLDYSRFPKCTTAENKMGYDQMILVRDISVVSLCEHHLQTIDGVAHIAYVPKDKVLGLSKFARVVEFFSRRPQIQERLTEQIFWALAYILETEDVGVVVSATHFCMRARGVMQSGATTQTDKMGGRFMAHPSLRSEFLGAIRG